jgi:hypothetical protein
MPFDTSSQQNDAAIREKVDKLATFIADDLSERTASGLPAGDSYLVIARSPKSPVAQALRANAAKLAEAGITVRAIFSEADPILTDDITGPFAAPCECRSVRDRRLLAAHEQLVLGSTSTWIGDSMRREPTKRDTYEHFAPRSVATTAIATRSFERIWRSAAPVRALAAMPSGLASQLPGMAADRVVHPDTLRRQ